MTNPYKPRPTGTDALDARLRALETAVASMRAKAGIKSAIITEGNVVVSGNASLTVTDGGSIAVGEGGAIIDRGGEIPGGGPTTDGNPPAESPVPSVIGGVGFLLVRVPALDTPDFTQVRVYVSTDPAVPTTGTPASTITNGGAVVIRELPDDGGVVEHGTVYYVRTVAYDDDGDGPESTVGTASTVDLNGGQIEDGTLTADKFAAETIVADLIAGGTIISDIALAAILSVGSRIELSEPTLDGENVLGGIVVYAPELDDDGRRVPLIQLHPYGSTFRGRVIADDVSVLQGLILRGLDSHLTSGSGMTIDNGVADPSQPVEITGGPITGTFRAAPAGYVIRGITWDQTNQRWLMLIWNDTTKAARVWGIDTAGVWTGFNIPFEFHGSLNVTYVSSLAVKGNYLFTCHRYATGTWGISRVLLSTGAYSTFMAPGEFDTPLSITGGGTPALGVSDVEDVVYAIDGPYGSGSSGDVDYQITSYNALGIMEAFDNNMIRFGAGEVSQYFRHLSVFSDGTTGDGNPELVIGSASTVYHFPMPLDFGTATLEDQSRRWTMRGSITNGGLGFATITADAAKNGFYSTYGATTFDRWSEYYPVDFAEKWWPRYADLAEGGGHTGLSPLPAEGVVIAPRNFPLIQLPDAGAGVSGAAIYVGYGVDPPDVFFKRLETVTAQRTAILNEFRDTSGAALGPRSIVAVARSADVVTITTDVPHGFVAGFMVSVADVGTEYNGVHAILDAPTLTTFTYARTGADQATMATTGTATTLYLNNMGGVPAWLRTGGGGFELNGDGSGAWPYIQPAGAVTLYAGADAPLGWLLADGASVLREAYPDLFAAIGTTYGSVDATHFTLPDLRGRVGVGVSVDDALGAAGGERTHTLTTAELPVHSHGIPEATFTNSAASTNPDSSSRISRGGGGGDAGPRPFNGWNGGNAGSGQAHNNLQPYLALNYIVKT